MANLHKAVFYQLDVIRKNPFLNLTCPFESSTYVIISNTTDANREKVIELSSEISNSQDVEAILDLVSWKMFLYSCQQSCR